MPRAGGRAQGLVGTTESASTQAQSIAQSHTGRETMTVYAGTSDGSHPPCPGGYFHSAPGERALSVEASGGWLTAVCRLLGFRLML